jgi:FixJ family two-component response regulator
MGKIDTVNKKLQILDEVIRKYDDFFETLNVIEQKVLTQLVSLSSLKAISLQLDVKTESLIQIRTRIANKWYRL